MNEQIWKSDQKRVARINTPCRASAVILQATAADPSARPLDKPSGISARETVRLQTYRCAGPYACTRQARRTAPRTFDLRVRNKNPVHKEDQ